MVVIYLRSEDALHDQLSIGSARTGSARARTAALPTRVRSSSSAPRCPVPAREAFRRRGAFAHAVPERKLEPTR